MPRWLNMVETNLVVASREEEFNDWYNNIHLPDVLETPGFVAARRYIQKEFRDGRGKYLALYEIETDDIDKTMALRREKRERERAQGHYRDLHVPIWRDVLWRLMTELTINKRDDGVREQWVNLVEVNCADASREEELNDWYNNIHLPDVLETPGFVAARRYIQKEFRNGRGKYLALYEIETDDIDKTMALRREKRDRERAQGRYRDLHVTIWRDVLYRQIFGLIAGE